MAKRHKVDTDAEIKIIIDDLEKRYSGAMMLGDPVGMTKIARAIAALKAPVNKEIFTPEFQEWYAFDCD